MKQLVVLLCVSVCCISTAVGYQGLPLLSLPEPHHLHKRQSESELEQQRMCQGIAQEIQCNNGLVQEGVEIALRCNLPSVASIGAINCQRNSNGAYCGLFVTYLGEITTLSSQCASTPCSSECREGLMSLREELGCCINSFNTTGLLAALMISEAFSYDLWSRCEVEPVTEQCRNNIRLPQTDVDPTCDAAVLLDEATENTCTRRFIEPVVDALMEAEDCQPFSQAVLEGCGVDNMGERCVTGITENTLGLLAAEDACQNLTCSQECVQALQTFNQTAGCCINSIYNGSLAGRVTGSQGGLPIQQYDFLTYEFWSNCSLQTPGECEIRLNGAALPRAPGIAVVILLLITHLAALLSIK